MTAYENQKRLHGGGDISSEFSRMSRNLGREVDEDLVDEEGVEHNV